MQVGSSSNNLQSHIATYSNTQLPLVKNILFQPDILQFYTTTSYILYYTILYYYTILLPSPGPLQPEGALPARPQPSARVRPPRAPQGRLQGQGDQDQHRSPCTHQLGAPIPTNSEPFNHQLGALYPPTRSPVPTNQYPSDIPTRSPCTTNQSTSINQPEPLQPQNETRDPR